MRIIEGGVTAPKGFRANAINCGIKKIRLDLALIYSDTPAVACGLFTQNRVQAAPIKVNKTHLKNIISQAIIVNSGNANCCTGEAGIEAALTMAGSVAEALNLRREDVMVASTGVIGEALPVSKIRAGLPSLIKDLSFGGGRKVAQAIMTTDKVTKEMALELKIKKTFVRLGGVAKGAGMIHPNMATMLCFITTDAHITRRALKLALKRAADKSFNSISVDGDTSTNDMVLALANGNAGGEIIDRNKEGVEKFCEALDCLMVELAKKIVRDGEGATKFVEIVVKDAASISGAKRIAKRISNSLLFKTSLFGEDPNWGRIAAAAGSSGVKFNPDKLDVFIGNKAVLRNGTAVKVDKEVLKKLFKKKDIGITVDLKSGNKTYRTWTTDLSFDYVKINAHYST